MFFFKNKVWITVWPKQHCDGVTAAKASFSCSLIHKGSPQQMDPHISFGRFFFFFYTRRLSRQNHGRDLCPLEPRSFCVLGTGVSAFTQGCEILKKKFFLKTYPSAAKHHGKKPSSTVSPHLTHLTAITFFPECHHGDSEI